LALSVHFYASAVAIDWSTTAAENSDDSEFFECLGRPTSHLDGRPHPGPGVHLRPRPLVDGSLDPSRDNDGAAEIAW